MNTMNNNDRSSHYWLDLIIDQIISTHPGGKIIISSGISPSGPYHVGHAREILTADALARGLNERNRQVRHLHFVDAHDALRKRYPYLPESYEAEAGKPLYLIPAPDKSSRNYAEQYFTDYKKAADQLGIAMEVVWTNQEYAKGKYTDLIIKSLQERDKIAGILESVSSRQVDRDWQPIQILDQTNQSLRTAKFLSFNESTKKVRYLGSDGKEYDASIDKGEVKLDWRCDWPARWQIYGVQVEGFGREHATKGGSYDTGKMIIEQVYGGKAPVAVPYEFINLKGETKKMSSSVGNLVTITDALKIIPPEILRYFTFKSRPERQLAFDTGLGLYSLVDEYAKTEIESLAGLKPEYERAWQVARLTGDQHTVSRVPFSHLVTSWQAARGDKTGVYDILDRTGFGGVVKDQQAVITRQLDYVKNWLKNFAPDNVKFTIQDDLSKLELSKEQKTFLDSLAPAIDGSDFSAQAIHDIIYQVATTVELKPAAAFGLLYQLFLGQERGPKLGFFLSSLDKEFVIKRLKLES